MNLSTELERPPALDSDEYKLTGEPALGRGCWGIVFPGIDVLTQQKVALKFQRPNDIAREQMIERGLTEDQLARKEARLLKASSNLIPTRHTHDKNGLRFTVMPQYEQFLDKYLQEAQIRPRKRGMYKTGLSLDEIVQFGSDIAKGIRDFQREEKRAHCDIKPDNIAVDKFDGYNELLIGDFGTATVASTLQADRHRSNLGFKYTRAPWLFVQDEPHRSCDTFAFGSMLYMFFTGEYLLQPEIDKFGDNKGELNKFMQQYTDWNYAQREHLISDRLKRKGIPKEFQKIIIGCATGDYADGNQLLKAYKDAMKKHEQGTGAKRWAKRALATGVLAGIAFIGMDRAARFADFFAPIPNYSARGNLRDQLAMRDANLSEYTLQAEQKYDPFPDAKQSDKDVHRYEVVWSTRMTGSMIGETQHAEKGTHPPSLAHVMIDAYIETIDELGYVFDPKTGEAHHDDGVGGLVRRNYPEIRAQLDRRPSMRLADDAFGDLVTIAEYALGANRIFRREKDGPGYHGRDSKKIDLENTCVTILFGGDQLDQYREMSRSLDYADRKLPETLGGFRLGYNNAMGSWSWSSGGGPFNRFMQQWMHNIQQRVKFELEPR